MSVLEATIADEIREREQRVEILVKEIAGLEAQLAPLRQMAELAQSLNGNGALTPAPGLVEQPKHARTNGDRTPSPSGRKGGDAPGGRGPSGRQSGSAPSRSPRTASASKNGDGGTKRAAVLAFVTRSGRVKIADIAAACDLSASGAKKNVQALVTTGEIKAEGSTRSRVYFTPDSPPDAGRGSGETVEMRDRVLAALKTANAAWAADTVAAQTGKDGHGAVRKADAEGALLALEQTGAVIRFTLAGGRLGWRAAE